jgi:hypothetical protein
MIDTKQHIFECGETGSGKTYLMYWLYKQIQGVCIFFNTQLEYRIEQASDALVTDMAGFREAWNKETDPGFLNENHHIRKYHKICFNPSEDEDEARAQLEELTDTLFRIGYQINKNLQEPKIWVHLFVDEIHEYSSKDNRSKTVDRIWRRGRRYGIVGIAASQRPADVSHGILSQCSTHIIFKVNRYESPYFQRYKIPVFFDKDNDPTNKWLNEKGRDGKNKHNFAVFTGDDLELYPPVSD